MFARTRNEIDQVELLPTRGWVQVKETSIRELVGDDGSVEELGRTPHRRVVTAEDAAELSAIFTGLNTTATTSVTQLSAQVAALTDALAASNAEASARQAECGVLKAAVAAALAAKEATQARVVALEAQLAALQPAESTP